MCDIFHKRVRNAFNGFFHKCVVNGYNGTCNDVMINYKAYFNMFSVFHYNPSSISNMCFVLSKSVRNSCYGFFHKCVVNGFYGTCSDDLINYKSYLNMFLVLNTTHLPSQLRGYITCINNTVFLKSFTMAAATLLRPRSLKNKNLFKIHIVIYVKSFSNKISIISIFLEIKFILSTHI